VQRGNADPGPIGEVTYVQGSVEVLACPVQQWCQRVVRGIRDGSLDELSLATVAMRREHQPSAHGRSDLGAVVEPYQVQARIRKFLVGPGGLGVAEP